MNTYRCSIAAACFARMEILWVLQSFNTIQRQGYRAISCEMQRLVALPLGSTRAIQSKKKRAFLIRETCGWFAGSNATWRLPEEMSGLSLDRKKGCPSRG